MKNRNFTILFIFSILTFAIFSIGVNNGATQINIPPQEASFDGVIFIGDTMAKVKHTYPHLEPEYLEGLALVDETNAYIFNDNEILVLLAKKVDDQSWDWMKDKGMKYDEDGYFLGKTRYEVIKGELLFTFYDNEEQDYVTLEKVKRD